MTDALVDLPIAENMLGQDVAEHCFESLLEGVSGLGGDTNGGDSNNGAYGDPGESKAVGVSVTPGDGGDDGDVMLQHPRSAPTCSVGLPHLHDRRHLGP